MVILLFGHSGLVVLVLVDVIFIAVIVIIILIVMLLLLSGYCYVVVYFVGMTQTFSSAFRGSITLE